MTTEQAAAHLGVKPETLYAYVSRGLLESQREPGGRRSRFARREVEALAARRRAGGRAGALDIIVETELTLLEPTGRLFYRGWDVEDAVEEATFEEVAAWLWTGRRDALPFEAPQDLSAVAARVGEAVPDAPAIDHLRTVMAAIRPVDPLRHDRRPAAVASSGRGLVAVLVESLPLVGHDPGGAGSVAARLWPRLSPVPVDPGAVALLDAALVLLADHELAASTLAARVAASAWADPYLVVQTGMAVVGGPLHGGSSEDARVLIREVARGERSAAEAVGSRLERGELIPGFGHRVYAERDPRADVLFERLTAAGKESAAVVDLVETMRSQNLPFANVDFALGWFAEAYDMVPGAGQVVFVIARVVGWLAHAVEEYRYRLRFRPRAAYVGPRPGAENAGVG